MPGRYINTAVRAPFQILVVPYRRQLRRLEVAVLHRSDHDIWQFVSGGGEDGETPLAAAVRESHEEAGLPATLAYEPLAAMTMVPASWFSAWADWPAGTLVIPEHAFAVDVGALDVVIGEEHRAVRWVCYDDAIQTLRFDSNKTALWELHERLFPAPRVKRPAFDVRHAGVCPCT
jgi:dATP pyrophosphohydrolase